LRILPFLLALIFSAPTFCSSLSIASYNIRNFPHDQRGGSKTDLLQLQGLLKKVNADLIAVQEIINVKKFSELIGKALPHYKVALSDCEKNNQVQHLGFIYNSRRPGAIGVFRTLDGYFKFTAIGLHLKSGINERALTMRGKQFKYLSTLLGELKREGYPPAVLLGDFNASPIGKVNHIKGFIARESLRVPTQNLRCSQYTISNRKWNAKLLDHIMVSPQMRKQVRIGRPEIYAHCQKLACKAIVPFSEAPWGDFKVSDHCPIKINVHY
jgi:endonuclease/exonuclease/phosphatase family metal-dependent hydrolase